MWAVLRREPRERHARAVEDVDQSWAPVGGQCLIGWVENPAPRLGQRHALCPAPPLPAHAIDDRRITWKHRTIRARHAHIRQVGAADECIKVCLVSTTKPLQRDPVVAGIRASIKASAGGQVETQVRTEVDAGCAVCTRWDEHRGSRWRSPVASIDRRLDGQCVEGAVVTDCPVVENGADDAGKRRPCHVSRWRCQFSERDVHIP
mmetsp:Transcript_34322/g.113590  ORF Transcript_34322/g.113590 Transcript_34322/m.113590 type:complete len:205 (-) Transcript_34322:35-649(-)